MADIPKSIHDPSADDRITELMSDPDHGTWRKQGEVGVFTPHPSFFHEVDPIQLATFFHQYGGKHQRLNLP
jgi:hypothetical protein